MVHHTAGTREIASLAMLSAPFFYLTHDANGEIIYVSPSAEEVLGYSPEVLIGRQVLEFLDLSNQYNVDAEDCLRERFSHSDPRNSIRVVRDSDGRERMLQFQSFTLPDEEGEIRNHVLGEDVSGKLNEEQALKQRLDELEQCYDALSQREQQVLSMVLSGCVNKLIARRIGVTVRAIENIRSRLMRKFGVGSSAQLASVATELRVLKRFEHRLHGPHANPYFLETCGNPQEIGIASDFQI